MNCNCHCNGKCKLLGGLEQKIINILWESKDPLKPSDVLSRMEGDYAYTTIMTVLKRMADKNILTRHQKGNVYFYSPVVDKQTFASSCLDDLFIRLFDSYGDMVAPSFLSVAKKLKIKV